MRKKFYNEYQLWSVHSEEVNEWVGKHAIATLKDGRVIQGVISGLNFASNKNNDCGAVEHLWVELFIEDRISIRNIKSLEINL